jgi:predicted ATP-dependent endonuclease of OLD family
MASPLAPLARPRHAAGYLMVHSISIKNFRSFNDVKIDDCRRVNIIVGENGSGKTALLEALFLTAGISPELIMRTRSWRGFEAETLSGSHEDVHQALWADLFHKFQTNRQAVVQLKGVGEENRSVAVTLYRRGQMRVVAAPRSRPGAPVTVLPTPSPIEFKWTVQGRPVFVSAPTFEGNNIVFPPAPDSHVQASFFAANRTAPNVEVANRFSRLSRSFRDEQFVRDFNKLYANITGLSVEVTAGSPMLFAKVESIPEKIPLTLASGGMSKLAGILLAMPEMENGLILVDEIENGLYHKRLPFVWKALVEFSRIYKCQLFLSTHSAECIEAAASLAEEAPKEFSIIRTVLENGETKIRHFGGDKFVEALEEHVDIR